VRTIDGKGRKAAIEILINTPIVADKRRKGEFHEIKAIMSKSRELGMKTFDLSLFELYDEGSISYDEAIRNADSANELRLNIKLNGKRQPKESEAAPATGAEGAAAAMAMAGGAPAVPEPAASSELSLVPDAVAEAPAT
jgi:twitching motility protein PilU